MSRTSATNFAGTLEFTYATAPTDLFVDTDLQTLALAVDGHDHTPGKGLVLPGSAIQDNSIGGGKLAANSVANANLVDGAVTSAKIADGTITSADIADGSIQSVDLAAGAAAANIGPLTGFGLSGSLPGVNVSLPNYSVLVVSNLSVGNGMTDIISVTVPAGSYLFTMQAEFSGDTASICAMRGYNVTLGQSLPVSADMSVPLGGVISLSMTEVRGRPIR